MKRWTYSAFAPIVRARNLAESNQRVSVLTLDGEVLARWGSKGPGPNQFTDAPHSIWADSRGDIYVSEVVAHNKLQKYVRT